MPERARPARATAHAAATATTAAERHERGRALAAEAREDRRRDPQHREGPLRERHRPEHVGALRRVGGAVGKREHRLGHRDDDADEQPGEDRREARSARDVGSHRVLVALGPGAREHGKEDQRHAEEELVREEGEGLALLVDGDPRLDRVALGLAREPGPRRSG